MEILPPSAQTWKQGERERMGFHSALTGLNMGQCVDVSPELQVESPVPELISVSWQGLREGTTGGPPPGGSSLPGFSTRM